jgi:putative ABC transport system permease protein
MTGVTAGYTDIQKVDITRGRFINEQDNRERRKVIVIEESTVDILFGKEDPIGKTVVNNGVAYVVAGVYRQTSAWGNQQRCYIPMTTGQMIYAANEPYLNVIMFTVVGLNTDVQMDRFEKDIIRRLAAEHGFSPEDQGAVRLYNAFEQFRSFNTVFTVMDMVLWIIGLGTLLAGIVGVSNIMLVTVRERTFEFGIRKALGAKPSSIIRLILIESVLITAFFGYMGMVLGVAVMEVVNIFVEKAAASSPETFSMFLNPTVNLDIAVSATVVLIIAGLIAGYIPARRAAQLKTIDAMRHNK